MSILGARLIGTIEGEGAERDRSLRDLLGGAGLDELLKAAEDLEAYRRTAVNLYRRVRASIFLQSIYRYSLQDHPGLPSTGEIPFGGVRDLQERRFDRAIAAFLEAQAAGGPSRALASALAHAYEQVTFQTLADQVRRSVRGSRGNRWMFRVGRADEHAIRVDRRLLAREGPDAPFPILVERTPVRLDLTHSAWSDIFFLGMDYPEGARVLNISVDLGVHGRDDKPIPPIETYCRVIAEPVLRLTSIDLNTCKDVATTEELFNFGNDYLGLIKAGIVASGLVPPSFEGNGTTLADILGRVIRPGYGLEVVSKVNDIPKGSRLAVSTNLLASLISLLMRATGQVANLTGGLGPAEGRVVVARAILGEWLGGSGGGWQDSGGVFPGVKLIRGVAAVEGDPEAGVSRGRLLPEHEILASATPFHAALAESLVLVHGGMAQNVGPILNMVTSKYLLRSRPEWEHRAEALAIYGEVVEAVNAGDVRRLGALTTRNWEGPLKGIIPWVSSRYTEMIIAASKAYLGDDFWGFLMLGGMSGGGMGVFVAPHRRDDFRREAAAIMARAKADLDDALPFAMEPVVYDFAINPNGTHADMLEGRAAMMPGRYYGLQVGQMAGMAAAEIDPLRRADVDHYANHAADPADLLRTFRSLVNHLFPVPRSGAGDSATWDRRAEQIRRDNGFDPLQHEQLREDLVRGRIGVARNRLPVDTDIRDAEDADLIDATDTPADEVTRRGIEALRRGEVAVVTLAAGVGSRWTTGAGVVKALNPFAMIEGRHRSFLEIHLAKTRRAISRFGATIPHVVTTSYLTDPAIRRHLAATHNYGHPGPIHLSRGQSIAQRLVPTRLALQQHWDDSSHERLDENKQKVREAGRRAILGWASSAGEGSDYVDNVPAQRFNPPGHFYEVPNLLRNGTLARLLAESPNLRWLMVHNVDTLGADLAPSVLGRVIAAAPTLAFEVIPRRIDDRGGGLARVGGRVRLLEGMAIPREELEFQLRYYNTLTTWVDIAKLLDAFGLTRAELGIEAKVAAAVRRMAARVPTYVTIKDVKRRWGHGQEDVYPVVQFEKLWGDLTALPDLACAFLAVGRPRGQQLKDAAQLDGWANDGSLDHVRGLCDFGV